MCMHIIKLLMHMCFGWNYHHYPKIYLFILGKLKHHGTTCSNWIFVVQCSFSMGYITQTIFTTPWTSLILTPPQNKNEWVHPVIFEPQQKIQLTQSYYKVTSFLDFQPFLKGFESVNQYLEDLIKDLNNPGYFQRLIYPVKTFHITPLSNESTIQMFFSLVTS